ncbi:putative Protein tyrosine and serine/threonine kinase [Monocercomonoides exilis]|uniref:putative Protein tyrosine and serine/threonine kinase n=1 Tax=Monocercomonoides exilis TaxID=2049356 RepID=UPI003559F5CD|nr:putative Protein tyrosine and serine/threonine kinase [Monocercomonoides exilis]|eukprot:MONOS_13770.1-p1 / transcript=MONOS_13770.1 / gene=MONOS_13770 / organism=Monocercomonoides_exilis_PA203 / gene_product=unspecified product / transcript_product=unspecified product / location=Mono_scaffold00880:5130-12216(-) / protein_length=2133 / sequence_SO=supercontig / SO=protein_coding / is_pseudo=false
MSSLRISSFELLGDGPFLFSNCLSSTSVSDAILDNITLPKNRKKCDNENGCSDRVLVESTAMIGCESPYSGGILSPSMISFRCRNSSFLKCFTTFNKRQVFSGGENEFYDDTFNVQSDESGGALYGEGNATIELHRCTLIECSSKNYGGAVAMGSSKGIFVSEDCNVQECFSSSETGGYLIHNLDSALINSTTMNNCSSNSKTCFYCLSFQKNSCMVISSIFDNASSIQYSSVTHIWYLSTFLMISNCLMKNCKSEYYAPCILFAEEGITSKPSVNLKYCLFHNNTAKNDAFGYDIHIGNFQQWKEIDKNNISDCYSTSASPRITRCNDGFYECTDISDLSSWMKDNENNHQITADYSAGIDHEQCGFAPLCRSIKYSLERTTSNSNKTLILRPSVFKEEQISISSSDFSVCGLSKNECVVQSASSLEPVFDVLSGTFCAQKVTMLQGNAESGTSMPFVVMDGDGSLTMEECEISSVDSKLQLEVSFMQIFGGNVELLGVGIAGMNFLSNSFISFIANRSGSVLHVVNTNFTSIQRLSGSGGIIERYDAFTGSVVVENCHFENVSAGKDGGGLAMRGEWKGELIVNGTSIFEGCCAGSLEEKWRGGGMFISADSIESEFTICENVIFSEENPNKADYGKDVFVNCGKGILLEQKVNSASFEFLDPQEIQGDVLKLSGSEDGTSLPVIPLCAYLCDLESPISIDERDGTDHSHCGYSVFCCSTIDFCIRERVNESVNSMEVISSTSIKNPFVVPLFPTSQISISSSSTSSSSSQYPLVNIGLTDNISTDCHNVIQCSGSFSLSFLSFVLPCILPSSISSIIQSTIFFSLNNISIAFSADNIVSSVVFSLIHVSGGELELTGLVVSEDVTFTALSPINVNGASRVAVEGCTLTEMTHEGGSGGCMSVETSGGGSISIKNTNISSKCENEEGLRGGGLIISVGSGGSLEMKNVNLSECEVPPEDREDGGRGMGGGMFVELPDQIGSFVLEGMIFEGCNGWKGKNVFVSGWDLREIVNNDHFKWEMSSEELESLDGLCGWERMTTGEEGYVIPLVVYLWSNWSGNGFVSKEKGFDFSGCGYSEAPCSSVDHMIKMRLSPVALEKSVIKVEGSASLKHSVSLLPSKPSDENRPLMSVEGGGEVFVSMEFEDSNQCGKQDNPCRSVSHGVRHVQVGLFNAICVDSSTVVVEPTVISDLTLKSIIKQQSAIHFNSSIEVKPEGSWIVLFENECLVEDCLFSFDEFFSAEHITILEQLNGSLTFSNCTLQSSSVEFTINSSLIVIEGGVFEMEKSSINAISTMHQLFFFKSGSIATISQIKISEIKTTESAILVESGASVNISQLTASNIKLCGENYICLTREKKQNSNREEDDEKRVLLCVSISTMSNITSNNMNSHVIEAISEKSKCELLNCSFERCFTPSEKGSLVEISMGAYLSLELCKLTGCENDLQGGKKAEEEICRWNGSVVDVTKSSAIMKGTTISNTAKGGITMSGGSVIIDKGEFMNNNPSIEGYPSLRRNIICSDSGSLKVMSLKGGDGLERNTSLWMLNEGCSFEGIVSERDSSFFIPVLESVEVKEETNRMKLIFKGMLLVPCNLSFMVVKQIGEEKQIEKHDFDTSGFLSETEAEGSVAKDLISSCGNEIEVSVHISFGVTETSLSTYSFILKNASESEPKGNENLVEGGKEGKSSWALIVIAIFAVSFLVVFVGFVLFVVRWRKIKNEAEDLREIVNDNIRKDPKAFEMVMMEMSPEEQWRRAEREAEKKNDERIKKRVYDSNMQHSESSEHLLSESGSTEYILGRDSDKIPEWALEKFDEEEDDISRKRTPSPSILSTSTTDTSDSDSTFVRGEDLCPTTSSMSNLVDATACSSPHEKLIVDLRDSLFMLLHGRNAKKEMVIGSLQQREQTAAQILFWVANLALHSFDEMENGLSSLTNLSPHIVLFSEHMVICVAMHSDCSSSDSDSSSISSSTVVTSASDDDSDSLPSSAFEDEDDFKKECLRWKAPELLMNRKMGASKKSVVFSIGMMLWECLTLKVPFGEYEAETAGQKIVNGERPPLEKLPAELQRYVEACWSGERKSRPTLVEVKRALFGRFPKDGAMFTVSDAITYLVPSRNDGQGSRENDSRETVATINEVQNIGMK